MNIGKLKAKIADLPDDMIIVIPAYDHSYRKANASISKIVIEGKKEHLSEYFGGESKDYPQPAKVVNALIIN